MDVNKLNKYKEMGFIEPSVVQNILNKLEINDEVLNICFGLKPHSITNYLDGCYDDLGLAQAISRRLYGIIYNKSGFITEVNRNKEELRKSEYDRIIKNIDLNFNNNIDKLKFNIESYYSIEHLYVSLTNSYNPISNINIEVHFDNNSWSYSEYNIIKGKLMHSECREGLECNGSDMTLEELLSSLRPNPGDYKDFKIYDKHCRNAEFLKNLFCMIIDDLNVKAYMSLVDFKTLQNILPKFINSQQDGIYYSTCYNFRICVTENNSIYLVCTESFASFINKSRYGQVLLDTQSKELQEVLMFFNMKN